MSDEAFARRFYSDRAELIALGVPLRMKGNAQPAQLRAVGVETARERLVGHLRIALDAALHVTRGEWPSLRHQEGDEGELPDQLVGVV